MHTELSIAMHSSIQMKLYTAAIIQGTSIIRQMATSTHAANIPILSAHQHALIEQSHLCISHGMIYCIILIEYSSKGTIKMTLHSRIKIS